MFAGVLFFTHGLPVIIGACVAVALFVIGVKVMGD